MCSPILRPVQKFDITPRYRILSGSKWGHPGPAHTRGSPLEVTKAVGSWLDEATSYHFVVQRLDQANQKKRGRFVMADETVKKKVVEVEFNEQQQVILQRLKEDGRYGATDGEIIGNVYKEFLKRAQISA